MKRTVTLARASGDRSVEVVENVGDGPLAGGADPRIENVDYARMLQRPQSGHLVREFGLSGEDLIPLQRIAGREPPEPWPTWATLSATRPWGTFSSAMASHRRQSARPPRHGKNSSAHTWTSS